VLSPSEDMVSTPSHSSDRDDNCTDNETVLRILPVVASDSPHLDPAHRGNTLSAVRLIDTRKNNMGSDIGLSTPEALTLDCQPRRALALDCQPRRVVTVHCYLRKLFDREVDAQSLIDANKDNVGRRVPADPSVPSSAEATVAKPSDSDSDDERTDTESVLRLLPVVAFDSPH
jgi:hypothetical protein